MHLQLDSSSNFPYLKVGTSRQHLGGQFSSDWNYVPQGYLRWVFLYAIKSIVDIHNGLIRTKWMQIIVLGVFTTCIPIKGTFLAYHLEKRWVVFAGT